jgi:hypothetical protein
MLLPNVFAVVAYCGAEVRARLSCLEYNTQNSVWPSMRLVGIPYSDGQQDLVFYDQLDKRFLLYFSSQVFLSLSLA